MNAQEKRTSVSRINLTRGLTFLLTLILLLALGGGLLTTQAQGPGPQGDDSTQGTPLGAAFTYQGRLTDTSGAPTPGPCDLRFTLYQSATGADQVGTPQTKSGVTLDNGYFSVALDFGTTAFTGEGRFLKIEVDCGSGYTALSPRVNLTPAPYALHAVSTGALHGRQVSDSAPANGEVLKWDGSSWMPAADAGGTTYTAGDGLTLTANQFSVNFAGTGSAATVARSDHNHDTYYWSLTGNSGATPGTNFLGTTDNQALQLHVNGARALRLEPHATSPNVIGGYSGNSVTAGVYGATIGGGGQSGFTNSVTANYGTVGGGYYNTASHYGVVGGGQSNTASGSATTVGGGQSNAASGNYSFVGGGKNNLANASGPFATIGGGDSNIVNGGQATVGGGWLNTANGTAATIGGGLGNSASGNASMVGGGNSNSASSTASTVGGGNGNSASGDYATVPGGIQAHASLYGQMAYASGNLGNTGDAQSSLYVMRTTSINTSAWENLYLDGSSALLTIAPNRTLSFDILVVGRSNNGESAGYYIWGVAENVGGTTTVWATTMLIHEDNAAWDAQVIADNTNDALAMQVMGNGEIIRWVATVRTAEVAW